MNTQPRPIPSPPTAAQSAPGALSLQWKRQPLPPRQAVQVLDFRAGEIALLEVEDGRVWVADPAGQGLNFIRSEKGAAITALALSPDAKRVAWADEDGEAGVADVAL